MTDEKYKKLIQAAVSSKEVRDYCEKMGRIFAPYELATLICQNTLLSYSPRNVYELELEESASYRGDTENVNIDVA